MTRSVFRNMPIWFILVAIAVFVLLTVNFFYLNTAVNMIALTILNVANAIRLWKAERSMAIVLLIVGLVCGLYLIKYLLN
ncbi:hypothetical protein MH215_09585 [Paenibacillus sp. ACRSA]|uniref:hypothetical protein n=1 Tax=Paenibacillus sp. ACRSA TaxID=2918211 RepID=UPI001EF5AD09|nr:hypothetical protein [Paenibacillus sp. ACRSA]MCG7377245.1 hypothetical protein [Paenibacillus sp. ACRSA]